ncbi:MAG: class IIb bacteriocin, lactobin A/cerein 7B family [Erysipelotrichales bacterium]
MSTLDVSFQELNSNELAIIDGGSITLGAALIYGACAVGGFAGGVGLTVATVKFLSWLGA